MQQQAYIEKKCSKQGFKEEANWKITNLKKRVKMGGGDDVKVPSLNKKWIW